MEDDNWLNWENSVRDHIYQDLHLYGLANYEAIYKWATKQGFSKKFLKLFFDGIWNDVDSYVNYNLKGKK